MTQTATPYKSRGKSIIAEDAKGNEYQLAQVGTAADAAFIVRAVNSHDALVAALEEARNALNDMAKDTRSSANAMQNKAVTAYMRVRDSFTKATGGHLAKVTIPEIIGLSRDYRTQRWRVTCPKCGEQFEPQTTMQSMQSIDCPKAKCHSVMIANYNAEPPTVTLSEQDTTNGC